MNIIKALMGEYPKFKSLVYADDSFTEVTVCRTLSPDHVDLETPTYVENKFKKIVPILKGIGVCKDPESHEQTITVTVYADESKLEPLKRHGKFNNLEAIQHLVHIAAAISEIAEDKLSEPACIKAIGLDCKPFICTDNESEETQANA